MTVSVRCPNPACGHTADVAVARPGHAVRCSRCGLTLTPQAAIAGGGPSAALTTAVTPQAEGKFAAPAGVAPTPLPPPGPDLVVQAGRYQVRAVSGPVRPWGRWLPALVALAAGFGVCLVLGVCLVSGIIVALRLHRPAGLPPGQWLDALEEEARAKEAREGAPGGAADKGEGKRTASRKRVQRWLLEFKWQNGQDYADQLRKIRPGTGAVVAYPVGDAREHYVIRDLGRRPAAGQVENIRGIDTTYWVEDRPQSVAALARALGVPAPPHFVVIFPPEFAEELARLEHDYAGRGEDEIKQTTFQAVRAPDGYRARVVSQTPKR